jgi:uncharacterized protein (DUF934 family)
MPLIKESRIVEDPWTSLEDETPLTPGVWPIVSLERWRNERESLTEAGVPLGLRLRSGQSPRPVAGELQHFSVIALEFPKFTDGRPYSSARLLRERYGFKGELRAVGHVLRDQALFLVRCGFDAFEVAADVSPDAWRAALARITVRYQAATDARTTAARLRRHPAPQVTPPAPCRDEEPNAAGWAC